MNHLKPSPRFSTSHALQRSRSSNTASPGRRQSSIVSDGAIGNGGKALELERDAAIDTDPIHRLLKDKWVEAETRIDALFSGKYAAQEGLKVAEANVKSHSSTNNAPFEKSPSKGSKNGRRIEDDYGDDEDEEEDGEEDADSVARKLRAQSPLENKGNGTINQQLRPTLIAPTRHSSLPRTSSVQTEQRTTIEDARKKLEQDKKATEDVAKRSFHTMFYTLESDSDAMLEQQRLDELDRQVENEMTDSNGQTDSAQNRKPAQGSLSTADLGASSLTLKNLIARIDAQRHKVKANDAQLRHLISEVRKGRSKWASEDKVGQEELYEAADKVLMELKAMTEYSGPFLQRVNKRDAPDYAQIVRNPMDIGTMIKKLKNLQYKSKKEFVADLDLIWSNCLLYNSDPSHAYRKKALYMRKETDKLIPLIPDVIVRDRAEVEAEERKNQGLDNDLDGGEDSEDDQPIMASRGRKAPSKGKGPTHVRGSTREESEIPKLDQKPALHTPATNLRGDALRADSEGAGDQSATRLSTPPRTATAGDFQVSDGINEDHMDVDGVAAISSIEEADEDDPEYKTWKQVTKKDRAMAAAERHRLFRGDQLNPDEPALLRTKAGMRRWVRQQKQYMQDSTCQEAQADSDETKENGGETLAEGIEKDGDKTLPDYYETLTSIPSISDHLLWEEDDQGNIVTKEEQYLKVYPPGHFISRSTKLTDKMEENMRQMQKTRKVCTKIGYVKQLQTQQQTYQNQFAKYDPQPFIEQDITPYATSEEGAIMAPWLCRTTFQRSIGEIFYHAGFEDFQPAALEAVTDVASDFFVNLVKTLKVYSELPRSRIDNAPKYSLEEQVLLSLHSNGLDIDSMNAYLKDDMERLSTKLGVVHERLKAHFAEIFRPALGDNIGTDGAGAFKDGSEQFVGGDFAEDIDEDFFGFRELGLLEEFGIETMSVPLHLLQNRLHNAYNANNTSSASSTSLLFPIPEAYEPVTADNLTSMIGLVQGYFASRLNATSNRPLIEDENLPTKQKFPKPRLGPTGKISSPRKRPLREQQQAAKKKRKLEELGKLDGNVSKKSTIVDSGGISGVTAMTLDNNNLNHGIKPIRFEMPTMNGYNNPHVGDPEKDLGHFGDLSEPDADLSNKHVMKDMMISPESIAV